MQKKFFIVTALMLALAAGLAFAAEQTGGRMFGHHRGGMLRHMAKELNLTDAQQSQIKTIMSQSRSKIQPLKQQLRQNEQAQNAAINGNFDETQARAFANKQAQIMSDLIVERQRVKSQIYTVLTPEQRQKALQLLQQHQQRMQEHMQKKSEAAPQTPSQ